MEEEDITEESLGRKIAIVSQYFNIISSCNVGCQIKVINERLPVKVEANKRVF